MPAAVLVRVRVRVRARVRVRVSVRVRVRVRCPPLSLTNSMEHIARHIECDWLVRVYD